MSERNRSIKMSIGGGKRGDKSSFRADGDGSLTRSHPLDKDVDLLFQLLSRYSDGVQSLKLQKVLQELKRAGIMLNRDPRCREFEQAALKICGESCLKDYKLSLDEFFLLMETNKPFLVKVLKNKVVIDDFESFSKKIDELYYKHVADSSGTLSEEIGELKKADKNLWGVAICSVDGQRKLAGDSTCLFTMQNLCKPFLHGLAMKTLGSELIDKYIAQEPASPAPQVLQVNDEGKPSNPLVDTGVVMLCYLLQAVAFNDKPVSQLQEAYNHFLKDMIENDYVDFRASAYQAKKENADLLRCISHGIASECKLPPNCNIETSLDLYLKACSTEISAEGLSVLGATLANGGVNPFSGKKVIEQDHVKDILSSIYTFGMYEFSGESAFMLGLPVKCSTSGGLLVVVPGRMGIGLYSPLLNEFNVSARAYAFSKDMVECFKLHPFDLPGDGKCKKFILRREVTQECVPFCELFSSAAKGDLRLVIMLDERKVNFFQTDEFGHNVLHVAAASGSMEIVKYLIDHYPSLLTEKDKWNRVPRDYVNDFKQCDTARTFDRLSRIIQ